MKINNILITGGAGYIGSHMIRTCTNAGYKNIIVLDNLSTGYKDNLPKEAKLVIGDVGDSLLVCKLLKEYEIDAVFHFAASISVEESIKNPQKYYYNNTAKTLSLVNDLIENKIQYFIFSSTAAIFGDAKYTPVDEAHPKNPMSPYGKSKLIIEELLLDISKSHDWFKFGCLRYFNVAGCDIENNLGIRNTYIKSLIPLLAKYVIDPKKEFYVFGNDYNTKDGTCIRDFISVYDICSAHLKLLDYLENLGSEKFFNLGSAEGYSVLEIIKTMEEVVGGNIIVKYEKRRAGDIPQIIADNKKAQKLLNWKVQSNLKDMLLSSYLWERKLQNDE